MAVDYNKELSPTAGWKTAITKVDAGFGMALGAITTTLGVFSLLTGRGLGGTGRLAGALNTAVGAVSLTWGKANWDSAAGATRARNFVELQDKLNQKQSSQGRA